MLTFCLRPSRLLLLVLLALVMSACAGEPPPRSTPPDSPPSLPTATRAPTESPERLAPTEARPTHTPPAPTPMPGRDPAWPSVFGVEVWPGSGATMADEARAANVAWVRINGIDWAAVEPVRGERDWSQLAKLEADLQAIHEAGLTPLVVIRRAPEWAQKVPGVACGPIREEALEDFADFVAEVATRYGQPPYDVHHWEFGNEPDVDPALVEPDLPFGCWGDASDPYYGGGDYAEALKVIYPRLKAADPAAQLVLGGLLLDCDPTHPPDDKTCQPSLFLEGILRNGGASAFDVVAYHAYTLWQPSLFDPDREQPLWAHRGGALQGKAAFIRETLARYGASKPIMMNEGGLLCHERNPNCPSDDFRNAQAIYLVRLYARAWADGLLNAVWYTLNEPGWRSGGLFEAGEPVPAYEALAWMAGQLEGATFVAPLERESLEGYIFETDEARYELLWTTDGSTVEQPLPEGARAVYDKVGNPLPLADPLPIGNEPLFVEVERAP